MKRPLATLFASLILTSLAFGQLPVERGKKVILAVTLDPAPSVGGRVIVYIGECKPDPKPRTSGCERPDGERVVLTGSAPVSAGQKEAKIEVTMPGIDPPNERREATLKVLYVLFRPPGSPALELGTTRGDTRIKVVRPKSVWTLPQTANIEIDSDWRFAVSGDSRNCGDLVMPAIAQSALQQHVDFYWHLGDFRKMGNSNNTDDIDEDMRNQYDNKLTLEEYRRIGWGDFITNQVSAFGPLPVYLGIGNHELAGGKTKEDYLKQFRPWLDTPQLWSQRLKDSPGDDRPQTYYHWRHNYVDFVYLDNSRDDGFEPDQIEWLRRVLDQDRSNDEVKAIVVGMHRALPNSLACGHSMNGDPPAPSDPSPEIKEKANHASTVSGRQVYLELLKWNNETKKNLYLLASHSHFVMDRIFETPYWNNNGGALPGWIVGTAGAQRYSLPDRLPKSAHAETYVYGYLLGSVHNGTITFEFQRLRESDIPQDVRLRFDKHAYTPGDWKNFIDFCFQGNKIEGKANTPVASCSDEK
jgi:hypothetical protein